ncbi:LuxR family transcriptional regulator [Ralstonia pickettii DTP0602]|nr:LuxR family transcriptional regulator [Ralstonia pickettii DTP0602]
MSFPALLPGPSASQHRPPLVTGPQAMPRARLLLIDDHTLFRTGLRLVLADSPSVEHIIEAGSVMQAVQDHGGAAVDILLLDIQMPGLNGIEGVKVLRRHFAAARILIVSGTSGLEMIPAEVRREIAGFLPKSADAREIEEAIACCLSGGTHFSGDADAGANPAPAPYATSTLTPRQLEVLHQLTLGRSNKVIAYHMGLSENTVRVHVAAILDHLGVVSRVEAILEAQRRGLVQAAR